MKSALTQRGAALVVVLLLLLVVTILGLASIRSTLLQERMAGNLTARSGAFQSAEAALREAEEVAAGGVTLPDAGAGCNGNGFCGRHIPSTNNRYPAWQAAGFWESGTPRVSAAAVNGITARYVIEDFGHGVNEDCLITSVDMSAPECSADSQILRITVRSKGDDGAAVVLQSLYEVP